MSATCLPSHHSSFSDLAILGLLSSKPTGPFDLKSLVSSSFPQINSQPYRRPQLDPLILETAALSSPLQTRNHYLHEYFPHSQHRHRQNCQENLSNKHAPIVSSPTDQPAPTPSRSQPDADPDPSVRPSPPPPPAPIPAPHSEDVEMQAIKAPPEAMGPQLENATLQAALAGLRASLAGPSPTPARASSSAPMTVRCEARTRIPATEGVVWLHLYTNTADGKEHLAFVVDGGAPGMIWSRTLDAPRGPGETALDRAVRGASVAGRSDCAESGLAGEDAPVVRIHSECFTGETLGSHRCDCGEQLRRALVHIARTPPHRGCVIYLRQEGRGIGLLNKLKAYNLQDLGFDTFEANLLLGFPPDARDYQVAVKVLEDLGLRKVRLMTNNPEKVEALEMCGGSVEVVERIPMVPSQWQAAQLATPKTDSDGQSEDRAIDGAELDRYLRTKVTRMRHLIPVPPTPSQES